MFQLCLSSSERTQGFGANKEKSLVSHMYLKLIKTKDLLQYHQISEASAGRCDWYVLTALLMRGEWLLIEIERQKIDDDRWAYT